MDLTQNHRALILSGLRKNDINKSELADEMGFGKAWVTKLLNGTLKTVSDRDAARLEEILGVRFLHVIENKETVSGLAIELSKAMETTPELEPLLAAVLDLSRDAVKEVPHTPRYFTTKELMGLGQEIIRLAFANEDKPGKVAREVLKLITE